MWYTTIYIAVLDRLLSADMPKIFEVIAVDICLGDRLLMKKKHPCGCDIFLVLRSGMDIKIRCEGCGREVMVPRSKIEKNIKSVLREAEKMDN